MVDLVARPLPVRNIPELDDVTITSLGDGEILVSSSGIFINQTLAEAGIAAVANVLLKDGSVSLTGNLSAGSNKITSLATPTVSTDAATKGYVDALAQGLDSKESVRVATTTAGTLATDYEDGDTVDGVTLATGDRILIKNQSTASENGIYVVAASGAPARAADFAAAATVAGAYCFVEEGTSNGDKGFVCTSNSGSDVVGTDSLPFTQFNGAGGVSALDDLSDVTITSLSNGQVLYVSGGVVVNGSIAAAGLAAASHTHTAGDITDFSTESQVQAALTIASSNLNDLADTNLGSPSDQQVVSWDNATGKWINRTISSGSSVPNSFAQGPLRNTMFRTLTHNTTSITDGAYCQAACWYYLCSSTGTTVSQGTGLGKSTSSTIITNSSGSNRRVGTAQIVEYYDCTPLRGQTVTFQMACKRSSTGNVRVAVLEWTGTANAPTKDVVNDWTSTTYTGGNFFISSSYNVLAVSSATSVGTSATNVSVTATVGASANNLVVFIWSDDQVADTGTIEFSEAQLPTSSSALTFQAQPLDYEIFRCDYLSRQYISNATNTDIIIGYGWAVSTTSAVIQIPLGHPIRTTPTLEFTASDWQLADSIGARQDVTGITITTTVCNNAFMLFMVVTVASGLTSGRPYSLLADTTSGRRFIINAEMGT